MSTSEILIRTIAVQERTVRTYAALSHFPFQYKERMPPRGNFPAPNGSSSTSLSIEVIRPFKGADPTQLQENAAKHVSKTCNGVETALHKTVVHKPEEAHWKKSSPRACLRQNVTAAVHASSMELVPGAPAVADGKHIVLDTMLEPLLLRDTDLGQRPSSPHEAFGQDADVSDGVREVIIWIFYAWLPECRL